jgi:hypothetical protein
VETIAELRVRLQRMTDYELKGYVVVAKIMSTGSINPDKPPRECFLLQLGEARAEWKRRHPKSEVSW